MKKLLEDELKRETECGRRSPSVIANLMGLDWLPAQNKASKQHKRVSDSYQKKCDPGGIGKENDRRSHRKHEKGQQKCKYVCEVAERSNTKTGSTSSRGACFRDPSEEDDVAFVRQKFVDAKRFSTDEKLRHSKEFYDALEVLDSNKDLLLKFLQQPNSMFTKHLHHLHGARESHSGCVQGMKSSDTLKCNVDVIGYHSGGKASQKIDISYSCNHCDRNQCNFYHRHTVDSNHLHFSAEGKADTSSTATRIVVLKPNLGKARNTARSVSPTATSCDPAFDNELQSGYLNTTQLGSEMMCKRSKRDPEFCGTKSRESRELSREVTRRMKDRLGVDSFNVSSSGYKGYSADESSGDLSENDSSYASEVTVQGSTHSLNKGIHNKASASPHIESSINREAKERLSKRWKMIQRSQENRAPGKGSTLAEMLTIPDVDIKPHNPDYMAAQDERLCRFGKDNGTTESVAPLGISSRDGWKDGGTWNSSRFRSLSASCSHPGSPKSSTRHEAITAERFLVRTRSLDNRKNRAFKRDYERKEGYFSGTTRSRNKEYQFTSVDIIDDIQEVHSSANMTVNSIDGKDSSDVKSMILEMASCKDVPVNTVVDTEHKSVKKPVNCPDELIPAAMIQSSVLPHDDHFNCDMSSIQQEPSISYDIESSTCLTFASTQPVSPVSSKESEQPSPVSILEAPFAEEVSSGSECFERVSAGLHGLRMQLQLLKQESKTYDEGSMLISSDECEEESAEPNDGKELCYVGESWESSYVLDVLTFSGFDEIDRDMLLETWHSPDCPIGPSVFDNLERKYGGWKSCLRSERKLLFNRINAGILQIFSEHVDIEPFVKPLISYYVSPKLWRSGLKTELHNILQSHEKVPKENVNDAAILGDMQWFKPGDCVSAVGRDIEQLLIDELVTEFVSLLCGFIL